MGTLSGDAAGIEAGSGEKHCPTGASEKLSVAGMKNIYSLIYFLNF